MPRKSAKSDTLSWEAYQRDRAKQVEDLQEDSERLYAIAELAKSVGWKYLIDEVSNWMESLIDHLDGVPRDETDTDTLAWRLGQFRGSRDACRSILNLPEICLKKIENLESQKNRVISS